MLHSISYERRGLFIHHIFIIVRDRVDPSLSATAMAAESENIIPILLDQLDVIIHRHHKSLSSNQSSAKQSIIY